MKILSYLILSLFAVSLMAQEKSAPAERQKIPIPKPFLACTTDAECTMTVQLCGCCDFTVMNKRSVKKYAALDRYCKEKAPLCKCTEPLSVPKCVKKLCQLAPKK